MDENRPAQPHAGTPPDEPFRPYDTNADMGGDSDAFAPGLSRKVLFGLLGLLVVVFAFGSAWMGYQYANTAAIAKLSESMAAPVPAVPAPAGPATSDVAPARAPSPAAIPAPAEPAGAVTVGPSAPPTLPSAEELLADRKRPSAPQPAPAALVRDLPDWLATEVGGKRAPKATADVAASTPTTAGSSADESAEATAKTPGRPEQQAGGKGARRSERPVPRERAAAVFARCPKPGESGAVECRRAVCSGAARKQGACAAYLN